MIRIPLQTLPNQEFSIVLDGQNCVINLRQMGGFLYLTLTADEVKICDSHVCRTMSPIPVWNTPDFAGRLFFLDSGGNPHRLNTMHWATALRSTTRRKKNGEHLQLKGHPSNNHS